MITLLSNSLQKTQKANYIPLQDVAHHNWRFYLSPFGQYHHHLNF